MMAAQKAIVDKASRQRQCGMKRRFRKEHEVADTCRWIKGQSGEEMHPYPCKFCKGWHIGH